MTSSLPCSDCRTRACSRGGEFPSGCPTVEQATVIDAAVARAREDALAVRVMAAASGTARDDDGRKRTRLAEIIAFCGAMGATRVGVAFCVAFAREARVLCAHLGEAGLSVVPVCCKVGAVGLADLGVEEPCEQKGTACNPITQAALLNAAGTELNVALGLCLGHDLLFSRHAEAPVTTFAVKDRALRNQPLMALTPEEAR